MIVIAAAAYVATVVVSIKVSGEERMPANITFYFILLSLFTLTITLVLLRRTARHFLPGIFSDGQRRHMRWTVEPWLALAAIIGTSLLFAAANNGGYDNRRCVDSKTMTVVALSNCGNPKMTAGSKNPGLFLGVYRWYYGGTGLLLGDVVHGGSMVAYGTDYGQTGTGSSTAPVSHTAK